VALRWHEGTATFEAPRGAAPAEPTLTAEAVAPYLGRYHDPANGTVVEMVFHNGTLAARLPGTPEPVEFRPPDEEGYWVLRLNPGLRIRFNEDEDGRVVSYTVYAPDGSSSVRPRVAGQEAR
jgi:hypothetical protein